MTAQIPDFTLVEQTFQQKLLFSGLSPAPIEEGISMHNGRLQLKRAHAEVLEATLKDGKGTVFVGSVEIQATIEHAIYGRVVIKDLITLQGSTPAQALTGCAEAFLKVTFPPLRSFAEEQTAPGATTLSLSSYTPELGKSIRWQVYTGETQITGPAASALTPRLKSQMPLLLMFDTLTGYLGHPQLHWCKLFGANHSHAGLIFGCAIDGAKSLEAEAEMKQKFASAGPVPGEWEFRQFFLMYPGGEADEKVQAELKQAAQQNLAPKRKGLLSRLFDK